MAAARYCPSCLSRTFLTTSLLRAPTRVLPMPFLRPASNPQARSAATSSSNTAAKYKRKAQPGSAPKKKKARSTYMAPDMRLAKQYSLVDAMQYLRAAEVGRSPTSSKYELHVRFRTPKNGAVIRNALRLPHPVKTDLRICVIAPANSDAGRAAVAGGAALVGEEEVFDTVRAGTVDFDRCICYTESLPKLAKANLGRVLGPRGLMPSIKTGTVTSDIKGTLTKMIGSSQYRERNGVVRLAIGQLGFSPDMLAQNVKAFLDRVRMDALSISDRTPKELQEVVLSSTNGPGFSLSGELRSEFSIAAKDLIAA